MTRMPLENVNCILGCYYKIYSVFWVVDDAGCVLVIAGLTVEGALLVISSTEDGAWTSSTRHLERLSVLQSPHLSIIIKCFIES